MKIFEKSCCGVQWNYDYFGNFDDLVEKKMLGGKNLVMITCYLNKRLGWICPNPLKTSLCEALKKMFCDKNNGLERKEVIYVTREEFLRIKWSNQTFGVNRSF